MTERLRVGFVGCGLIAASHARALARLDGVEIGPVSDLDRERADAFARRWGGSAARVVDTVDQVVANCDAVYVCTWTSDHPAAVSAAARAGRALFCEKPLAVDLDRAEAMVSEVAAAGVPNQVGLVLRASPAFRWLHHHLSRPEVGPVMNVVFRDDQYIPVQGMYGSTWRADPDRAGRGTLLEHSIHDLDLLGWWLGPIDSVTAVTADHHGLGPIEDAATVTLVARSGAQASLVSVWHEVRSRPSQRRVEVLCRDAVLTVAGDWSGPVTIETSDGAAAPLAGEELTRAATDTDGAGGDPDAAFVAAVRAGRPAHPDFRVALTAHRLVDAAYRSAAAGGVPVRPTGDRSS